MVSLTLSFNDVNFSPVQHDKQIWLSSGELAQALGYKQENAVSKIFNRNSDEFTEKMTQIIDNPQLPNLGMRIFSLRGCHLIAMLARTAIAKQFRKWVLDILDKEVGSPIAKTHKEEREPLTNSVNLLVAKTKHLNYSDAYKLVHQRFNVKHIDEIPYDEIPIAVEYVHHLIALYGRTQKQESLFDNDAYESVRKLTESIILENDEIVPILLAVKMIDEKRFAYLAHKVVRTNENARIVSQQLDFRSKIGEPLIDGSCQVISLSTGQRFAARPNWFNAPA